MRGCTNWLWILLSGVEGLSLGVSKVLLLMHLSRSHGRAGTLVAVRRVLQALGCESRRHASSTHVLVRNSTVGLRRLVVGLLRLESTTTAAVGLEALVAGLRRFAAHVGGTVGLSRHCRARLDKRISK